MAPPCRLIHKLGAISSFPFEGALVKRKTFFLIVLWVFLFLSSTRLVFYFLILGAEPEKKGYCLLVKGLAAG